VFEEFCVLNLELSTSLEMFPIAVQTAPDWLCLVPEKREERTTEGGLNLKNETIFNNVKLFCEKWKTTFPIGHKISLFLEADQVILERAMELPIDAVEIHTGAYAKAFLNHESLDVYFSQFALANQIVDVKHKKNIHAGHGLTDESVVPLLKRGLFAEYNIGHWIISQSIFQGIETVVSDLNRLLKTH
jgi:pyridoxine 5-phosphate synthase